MLIDPTTPAGQAWLADNDPGELMTCEECQRTFSHSHDFDLNILDDGDVFICEDCAACFDGELPTWHHPSGSWRPAMSRNLPRDPSGHRTGGSADGASPVARPPATGDKLRFYASTSEIVWRPGDGLVVFLSIPEAREASLHALDAADNARMVDDRPAFDEAIGLFYEINDAVRNAMRWREAATIMQGERQCD